MLRSTVAAVVKMHRFLAARAFYALWFASVLSCTLLAYRIDRTDSWQLRWLAWNLFLAWVPYGASLVADWLHQRLPRHPWLLLPFGGLWLAFLPNAPYIVTDLMHLTPRGDQWLYWYDVIMVVAFAWTGCVLGAISLGIAQGIVARYLGRFVGWLFVLATAGLCGFGIYVGRFLRWNSWDLLANPRTLLLDLTNAFQHPLQQPRPYALCALFAAFVLVGYLTLTATRTAIPSAAQDR